MIQSIFEAYRRLSGNVDDTSIVNDAKGAREILKQMEADARENRKRIISTDNSEWSSENKSECISHATLALRSLELARMHFGKVIQYSDQNKDGESCYSKSKCEDCPCKS